MRVRITVTDDQGRVFEGETDLSPSRQQRSSKSVRTAAKPARVSTTFMYALNPRAFMNRYARNGSGAQKFTLLLACLAKGDSSKEVAFDTIKGQWMKMKSLIGKFNPSFSIRAKDKGWVDTKKAGVYFLTQSWKEAAVSDG
jgi:hypothetical protein